MWENEEGKEIEGYIGRFGPYVRIGKKFFSLPKVLEILDVELDHVLELYSKRHEKYVGSETSELLGTTQDAKLVYPIFKLKTSEHYLIGYWEQK